MSFSSLSTPAEETGGGSMAQLAYQRLRERLVLLDIPPGAPLNEQALAAEFRVGRTPLREAMKRLENEHFLISYPRRGTFATRVDATALSEISEIRRALEPLAARRAALRLDPASRAELENTRDELRTLGPATSTRDSLMADMRAHGVIYRAARNAHLASSLTHYLYLAMRIWRLAASRMPAVEGHVTEHLAILDAILDGDEEAAGRLMLEHLTDFEESIRRVL